MEPDYIEGNRVLTFNWFSPQAGDVIVFKLNRKYFIKRIEQIRVKGIYVFGDNKKLSSKLKLTDSHQIVGRVILKY